MAKQATKKKAPAKVAAKAPAAKKPVSKKAAAKSKAQPASKKPTAKTKSASAAKAAPAKKPEKVPPVTKKEPVAKEAAAAKPPARKRPSRAKKSSIVLPAGYLPTDDEPFMSDMQREYFRQKLVTWKDEIIRQTRETLEGLNQDSQQHADLADRATSETDRALELRARDRQRKLVNKINAALSRIEDGSYGYCDDTGEPIGLKRLDARPIATLSLEAQERHERREKVYRED